MTSIPSTVGRDEDALFVKDGVPVKFCFHRSVTQGRRHITRDVKRHGGKIVADERDANVLLVDEQEDLAFIRRRYYSSIELYRLSLYVEPRGFVQDCVRSGTYIHVGPVKQGMPGRTPGRGGGRGRVPFTEEDRDHLAYYLATRCPTRDGRMGNSVYKDLERLARTDDPSWSWAERHTWHSWREHYKMNPTRMDPRIDYYLERLKDVGHHLGHDLRRHDHRELRQEEEEDDEEEEGEQGQGIRREGSERRERQQVRPAVAARRARVDREGGDGIQQEEEEEEEEEEEAEKEEEEEEEETLIEPQRAKRHRVRPDARRQREVREVQAKRVRISEAEAGRDESIPAREKDSDNEASPEIEGSDLFGDRAYGDESRFEFDNSREINFPTPFFSRAGSFPEPDSALLSTQATLIASPLAPQKEKEKESTPAPGPTPTKVVEARAPTSEPTVPSGSQQSAVATRERVVQRARVRGASVQPGPSVPKETRTRGGVEAVDGPHRNTRARSRLVEPQPQPQSQRQREDQGGRGKGKAREVALVSIEEDAQVEEESSQRKAYADEPVVVTGGILNLETFEDEMVVKELSAGSEGGHNGDGRISGVDEEDESVTPELPRFQEIEIGSDPTDSDDAETHGSLVQGAVREGVAGAESQHGQGQAQDQNEDSDEDNADADRIERMARGSLHVAPAPAPTPLEPRVTRSMVVTQLQMRTPIEISPRRTRSERARGPPITFPSPGTKARAMVSRFQEERWMPYEPPEGSRVKAVRRRRRG